MSKNTSVSKNKNTKDQILEITIEETPVEDEGGTPVGNSVVVSSIKNKISGSILYTKASADLAKAIEKELQVQDPDKLSKEDQDATQGTAQENGA